MKKTITLILVAVMLFCICGCTASDGNNSSDSMQVELEETVVDENGNVITNGNSNNTSDNQNSNNSVTLAGDNSDNDTDTDDQIVIDYETIVEVDICDDILRAYLDATDPARQYTYLSEYQSYVMDHQKLAITWQKNGSKYYTAYISENADFSNAYECEIKDSQFKNAVCVPGKTYYWKVIGEFSDKPLGGGRFRVKDAPVRFIKIEGVSNVRDMGGWKTESGKTVKYEKIYRGARLDNITDTGLYTLKYLGIKTDIDIRSTQSWDSYGAVAQTELKYHFFDTSAHYDYVFDGMGNPVSEVKANYPKMFELLADESNYPIYLHCNYGNDRTGSMAFILNGLLGVNYEDLTRDYEITSYAFSNDNRWRGDGIGGTFGPDDLIQHNISNSNVDGRWGMMNKAFMESKYCTDGKLSTAIENFLLDAGVKQQHIDSYKKIMLG